MTRAALVGAVAFLPAFSQVDESPPGQQIEAAAPHHHRLIRDRQDHHDDGASTSTYAAGYAVTGTSFTSVKGSWTVPAVNCSGVSGHQFAAFLVDIDGFTTTSTGTIEAAGTDSDCVGSQPSYYAWYQFVPNPEIRIRGVPVSPGDHVSASVTYSSGEFTETITNETTGKSFTKSKKVTGAMRASVEWVQEAAERPGNVVLPLSDYGAVFFGQDNTGVSGTNEATSSSNRGPIGSFPSSSINKITKVASSGSPQTATPSALSSDGTSFSCTWAP